jgi:hypothetical protein
MYGFRGAGHFGDPTFTALYMARRGDVGGIRGAGDRPNASIAKRVTRKNEDDG